jgi:hypothetical protein
MAGKVLEDHRRMGKVFTPPLLTIGTFVDAGWIDFAVPEFIWILLLTEEYGRERGTILFLEFTTICDAFITPKSANGSASCIISSYASLTTEEKSEILALMSKKHILEEIQLPLGPFLKLYPECPLQFLASNHQLTDPKSKEYLLKFKSSLERLMDKAGVESTYIMAAVAAFLITFHRISIVNTSNIPPLSEVVNYPNTDNSRHLGSFLRTAIPMCFNVETYNRKNIWANYFWNQSFKLEPYKL